MKGIVASMEMWSEDPATPMDEIENAHGRLLATLLATAKMLQTVDQAKKTEDVLSELGAELKVLTSFYDMHGDGEQLERDTLQLATLLGFNVQQHYISEEGHA